MTNFDQALSYTLALEGSAYTDAPLDRGGPTKYGITLQSWIGYCGWPKTADDIKNLTPELARAFYRQTCWLPMNLDAIGNDWVATICFDMAVNMGVPQAAMIAQRAAKATPVDGKIGPKTVAAINGMSKPAFVWAFFEEVQRVYVAIVQQRPDQSAWLSNWLSRSRKIISPLVAK